MQVSQDTKICDDDVVEVIIFISTSEIFNCEIIDSLSACTVNLVDILSATS